MYIKHLHTYLSCIVRYVHLYNVLHHMSDVKRFSIHQNHDLSALHTLTSIIVAVNLQ